MLWAQICSDMGAKLMTGRIEDRCWPQGDFTLVARGIDSGRTANRFPIGGGKRFPPIGEDFAPYHGSRPARPVVQAPFSRVRGFPEGQNTADLVKYLLSRY